MKNQVIQTAQAPQAIGPYSQAIYNPPFLFVSGQIGLNPKTGEMVSHELAGQAKQSIENLIAIVQAAGGDVTDITAVDVFLPDISRFAEFNAIYLEYFSTHKPARAAVGVAALPKGAQVEVKCIAIVNQ